MNYQGLQVNNNIIIIITSAQLTKERVRTSDRPVVTRVGPGWALFALFQHTGSARRAAGSRPGSSTRRAEGPQLGMHHGVGEEPFRGLGRWLWDHKAIWSFLLAPRLCQDGSGGRGRFPVSSPGKMAGAPRPLGSARLPLSEH